MIRNQQIKIIQLRCEWYFVIYYRVEQKVIEIFWGCKYDLVYEFIKTILID